MAGDIFEGNGLWNLVQRLSGEFVRRIERTNTGEPNKVISSDTAGAVTVGGDLKITGLARRIIADMDHATHANRLAFVGSTVNSVSTINVAPNGTGGSSNWRAHNAADLTNAGVVQMGVDASYAYVQSTKTNAGVALPFRLVMGAVESFRATTTGALVIGGAGVPTVVTDAVGNVEINGNAGFKGTARRIIGDFSSTPRTSRVLFQSSTVGGATNVGTIPNGAGTNSAFTSFSQADTENSNLVQMLVSTTEAYINAQTFTASFVSAYPLIFKTGGAEVFRYSANRALWIGRTTASVLTDALGMVEVEGSVSVKTSTVHIASAAPGSPLAGETWQDSTQKTLSSRLAGNTQNLIGCLFTATADSSANNTVTETSLFGTGIGSRTLAANFFAIGKTLRLKISGYWGQTNASPARTIKIYYGATVLANIALPVFATAVTSPKGWTLDVTITARTLGAAGTVYTQGLITLTGDAGADSRTYALMTSATVAIDTTASSAIGLKWTWGTAAATNTITATNGTLEALN